MGSVRKHVKQTPCVSYTLHRTLFPFPLKSRNTQRPSRIARCPQFIRDNSPRRNAHVTSTASRARSRIPRMLCGLPPGVD
jgi:hypothetical protein